MLNDQYFTYAFMIVAIKQTRTIFMNISFAISTSHLHCCLKATIVHSYIMAE